METLKKLEKDGKMSRDEHDRMTEEVQKATDRAVADIDQALATKEKEIMTV
jgi:ribosome recycling factor